MPLPIEMQTTWDYHLVVLSVVIAIFGSFIALDFAGRMKSAEGKPRKLWFAGGALMMGLTIWTMHFVGMLALIMPMPVTYDAWLMTFSILAAAIGSAIAFAIMHGQTLDRIHMIAGSVAMGLAIAAMHYTGMVSMRMMATIHYDFLLFLLSIVIAVTASAAALWIAFRMRRDKPDIWFWQKVGSAVVMGFAISGMHYSGMAAAHYYPTGEIVSGLSAVPTVGSFRLSDLLIIASVLFGVTLLLLMSQTTGEMQQALKQARENEKRFLGIFEQAAVGIALVDLNGEWLNLNRKYCGILGFSQAELLGKTFLDVTHPDDLETDIALYQKLKADEIDHYMMEKRYIRKDGSLVWTNLTVSLVRDEHSRPIYAIAVAEDITERKRAEEALQKSAEREQLVAEIIDNIRSETELDIILQKTVNNVGRFTQADRCLIWFYDSDTGRFQIPEYEYLSSDQIMPIAESRLPDIPVYSLSLSPTETVMFSDLPQVSGLTEEDRQIIRELGIQSLLHVPIAYKHQFLGALRVHSVLEKQDWDLETIELVKHMAAQAAVAIYHARTLQELRESEARKSGILESSQDAIITMDQDGAVCEWNPGAERMLGYSVREAIGREMAALIIPERYRDAHRKGLAHYLATGEGPVMDKMLELPVLRADGTEFLSELTITRLPVGGAPLFTGTLRDISERKRAEDDLRDSEARMRAVLENTVEAIITIDEQGRILSFNQAATRLFGYLPDEAIGKNVNLLMSSPYRETHDQYIENYLTTGIQKVIGIGREFVALRKDGSMFTIELAVSEVTLKDQRIFTGIIRDITAQKKAQEALQNLTEELEERVQERTRQLQEANAELKINEERFRLLVETVKDYAIYRLDPEGIIQTWNQGAERLKGYAASEVIGRHYSKFYPPEALAADYPAYELRMARENGRFENEGWRIRKDGGRFWANVVLTALYDRDGALIGFTKITRDLTERKKTEEQLMASEQRYRELSEALQQQSIQLKAINKEIEAFSYSVSHDLRAPLRGIDGFSQVLLERYGDKMDDQAKNYLNRVRQNSQQMGQLIDDMLHLSRLTRGDMTVEPADLGDIVCSLVQIFAEHEPERRVEWVIADQAPVFGDKNLLKVALHNLLDNAWKYTSKHPTARIEFGIMEHNGQSVYFVRDDGAGFNMEYADKLFGAFQRLHGIAEFPGTGVGLATVARIIHRHGGEIWAEGEVEKGATFYFTLGKADAGINGRSNAGMLH